MGRVLSIEPEDLDRLRAELAALFPIPEFEKIVQGFSPEKTRGLDEYALCRAKAHPLATSWHDFLNEIEKTKTEGAFKFSKSTYLFIDTLCSLLEYPISNRELIIRNMMNAGQFHSALFEAEVAAAYSEMGYQVRAVPERPDECIKTPDLEIMKNGEYLYVECKSLEDQERKDARLWDALFQRLIKIESQSPWCWDIHFKSGRRLKHDDIVSIEKEIANYLERGRSFYQKQIIDGFSATGRRLVRRGEFYITPFSFANQPHARVECDINTRHQSMTTYANPVKLSAENFIDLDVRKRVEQVLKSANRQFKQYLPGVVHVQVPFRNEKNIIDSTSSLFNRLFCNLSRHNRLSAVVMQGKTINPLPKNGGNIINRFTEIIPNPHAIRGVPECFRLVGADDPLNVATQLQNDGTVLIEFDSVESSDKQVGLTLCAVSLHDGKWRFRVWYPTLKKIRVDIVDARYGLRYFDYDSSILRDERANKLAARYSSRGFAVSINGSEVMSCEQDEELS
jgi:hypothetical protein